MELVHTDWGMVKIREELLLLTLTNVNFTLFYTVYKQQDCIKWEVCNCFVLVKQGTVWSEKESSVEKKWKDLVQFYFLEGPPGTCWGWVTSETGMATTKKMEKHHFKHGQTKKGLTLVSKNTIQFTFPLYCQCFPTLFQPVFASMKQSVFELGVWNELANCRFPGYILQKHAHIVIAGAICILTVSVVL